MMLQLASDCWTRIASELEFMLFYRGNQRNENETMSIFSPKVKKVASEPTECECAKFKIWASLLLSFEHKKTQNVRSYNLVMKTYFDPTCRFSSSFKCLLVIFYSGSHQLFHFPIFLFHFLFCLHVPCVCVHNILRNPSKVIKRRPFHFSYYLRWCFCLGCFLSTWYVSLPPFCVCLSINLMRILFVWPSNVNIISRWLYIGVWLEL